MGDDIGGRQAEDQWALLVEHGFSARFACTWVESDAPDTVAAILRADPGSRLECDLGTAMRWYQPYSFEEIIWVGPHSLGWTQIITLSGLGIMPGPLSEDGRRLFYVEYDDGEGGVHGLDYWRDGEGRGKVGQHSASLGELEPLFDSHGIDLDAVTDDESELNAYLDLAGRVTGRNFDRDSLASTRALYRIPDGAWD